MPPRTSRGSSAGSSGAYDVIDGYGHGVALSLSPEVGWGITGTSAGFCVAGYTSDPNVYTPQEPLFYDSLGGGLSTTPDGACNSSAPPTMSAPVTGGTGGGGPVSADLNWVPDSGFQRPDPGHLYVGALSSALNLAGKGSPFWSYRDIANPAGTRALQVSTRWSSAEQGVIIYPSAQTPMPATHPIVQGEQYTVSAWVRGPQGQPMWLVARVVDQNRGWRGESAKAFVADGTWQRVSHTITGAPSTAGFLLAMHVQTGSPYPSVGATFEVAGPMINAGELAPYEQSAP